MISCRRPSLAALFSAVFVSSAAAIASAQAGPAGTADVFRQYADQVVKVQVVETDASARAELGSGFFVTARGHIVTNYHVVAKLVHEPDRYRAEVITRGGETHRVSILGVDVIHDLAVLASELRPAKYFELTASEPTHGERLYSLGHPRDLGLSIVEGTYNGHLRHTLYPKIHFTGSLNPGMSGGPTLSPAGRVVGVNVSTAGNQVSFLVPAERAARLLATVLAPEFSRSDSLLGEVARQIRDNQDVYLAGIFGEASPTVRLGQFVLPTEPAPFFRCWGDATRNEEQPYEIVDHYCSTDDHVFISGEHWSGIVELDHRLLSTEELNPLQFFSLYTSNFQWGGELSAASSAAVTEFRCETRNVRVPTMRLRTVLCVRRYRKLDGLYDAVLKAAALGGGTTGVVTTLTLSGVSFENIQTLSKRYLESIAWHR
ncbi:MAG TPA: serine protease [Gemmatimonadaceae bacterium]|nr:serine protease [Gemmatimonadaceae bacterium]